MTRSAHVFQRWSRRAPRTAAIWAILVVTLGLIAAGFAPSAHAQRADVSINVVVDGDHLTIGLSDVDQAVGALDIRIFGIEGADDECEISSGFGVCSLVDGGFSFVAFNPTGWSDDTDLVTVALRESVAVESIDVQVSVVTDVEGVDLPARVVGSSPSPETSTAEESSGLVPILVVGGVLLSLVALYAFNRSRSAADSSEEVSGTGGFAQ